MRVVDASVAIDALRGRGEAERVLAAPGDLVGSEITRFEILAGIRPHEEDATEQLLSELFWLSVDDLVARTAASLARVFRAANVGIDDADYLVAPTAVLLDAELLTTNVKHFPMFPGLRPAY